MPSDITEPEPGGTDTMLFPDSGTTTLPVDPLNFNYERES